MTHDANKIVYLIASGPTTWQDAHRVQGNTDLPLRDQGLEAVRSDMTDWMASPSVRTVHTAPDEASRQTAAWVAEQAGGAKVKVVDDFAEMDLGLWQGLTEAELHERYPKVFGRWRADPSKISVPEGESLEEVTSRVASALDRLLSRSGGGAIAIVLRPVVLRLCSAWLGGVPIGDPLTLQITPPPPVQRFEIEKRAWRDRVSPHGKKRISA